MRISDWSSDVCSSDLVAVADRATLGPWRPAHGHGSAGRRGGGAGRHAGAGRRRAGRRWHPLAAVRAVLRLWRAGVFGVPVVRGARSEEHTSELQSLMRISYAVFCLKKKNKNKTDEKDHYH